jgi:hypothetical protein
MGIVEKAAEGFPFQALLLVGGLAALLLVLGRRRRRDIGDPRPPGAFEAAPRDSRQELEHLLAEIQDLSRDHIARLDTKIRLLTQLLADADQKKRELDALLERAAALPRPPDATPAPSPRPAKPANPLHDRVYTLQDAGKDVGDICRATGLEKGEVELILGLRKPDSRI